MNFNETLNNEKWLRDHEDELRSIFPAEWTHVNDIQPMKIAWNFKLLGIEWRSAGEFGEVMVKLINIGLIEHDPNNKFILRANPLTLLKKDIGLNK